MANTHAINQGGWGYISGHQNKIKFSPILSLEVLRFHNELKTSNSHCKNTIL